MISIIIILKNDPEVINTIQGLNKMNKKSDLEIIVVDRSTIKYPRIVSKIPLTWISFDPKGKRFTIANQRNAGIRNSKGEIIVFIDASCVPDPRWIEEITRPILKENEKIVMGRTGSIGKNTLNDLAFKHLAKNKRKYVEGAATINLAISKEVFKKIGYFDETFDYGSDMDFTWRASDAGFKVRYQESAFVAHNWGTTHDEIKRTILYGRARARLMRKHWKTRWKNLFTVDSPALVYPLLIIGLPIALIFPAYLFLFVLLVLKNIKEPNPVGIVMKHIVYGWGVILEIVGL